MIQSIKNLIPKWLRFEQNPELAPNDLVVHDSNIVFNGDVEVSVTGSVITSSLEPSVGNGTMFEFINVYPNPSSDGLFTLTYAISTKRDVEISVVNEIGQVMKKLQRNSESPGIHKLSIDTGGYPSGIYKMILSSEGKILSKSVVKN